MQQEQRRPDHDHDRDRRIPGVGKRIDGFTPNAWFALAWIMVGVSAWAAVRLVGVWIGR